MISLYDAKKHDILKKMTFEAVESFNLESEIDLNDLCNLEYFTILNLCPNDDCDERTGCQDRGGSIDQG